MRAYSRGVLLGAAMAALATSAFSTSAQPAPARPVAQAAPAPPGLPGYLPPGGAPEASVFLPPVPQPGSLLDKSDVAAYQQTRKLEGSARWRMAAADAGLSPAALMDDFACALGVRLTPETAPGLARLIARMGRDAGGAAARVKDIYRRPRPFMSHPGNICLPRSPDLTGSWSYPSGHATYSWAVGLVLSELAPDRTAAVLGRARAYGESRVVCGVHYVSDVERGRDVASGVVAALHADPGFQAELSLAKTEVAAARARAGSTPDAGQCRAEQEAIAQTPPLGTAAVR